MDETIEAVKLTAYSKGAGCGCKISPAILKDILRTSEEFPADPRLLVGNESNDDASVLDLGNGECLISTTDFFMPVVDDAYTFGKIAAANSLSDVYAMGGKPITALAILGWPVDKLSPELAQRVLEGARFVCRVAGITLAGGHSIESAEPIFGLAVNGLVKREQIKRNNTAQVGDKLYITKPIGMGVITTAAKRGVAKAEHIDACISYMIALNKIGEALGNISGVHALTDITGFGLAGHLIEMCEGSHCSADLEFDAIPMLPFLNEYLDQFIYPDMSTKNFSFYSSRISTMNAKQLFTLCDPQTSGGLLVAVSSQSETEYLEHVHSFGLQGIADKCVGVITEKTTQVINLK